MAKRILEELDNTLFWKFAHEYFFIPSFVFMSLIRERDSLKRGSTSEKRRKNHRNRRRLSILINPTDELRQSGAYYNTKYL